MQWSEIESNWEQIKASVKEKWNQLTDDDINQMQGRREKLEGILQERYGRTEQEARQEVDLWLEDTRLRLHNS